MASVSLRSIHTVQPNQTRGGTYFETSGGVPALLNDYELNTGTFAFSATTHLSNLTPPTFKWVKVGNLVVLSTTSAGGFDCDSTSATGIATISGINANLYPSAVQVTNVNFMQNCTSQSNATGATAVSVQVTINPSGLLSFATGSGSVFTVSKSVQIPVGTVIVFTL